MKKKNHLFNHYTIPLFLIIVGGAVNVLNQINRNTPSPMSQNGNYICNKYNILLISIINYIFILFIFHKVDINL